MTRAEKKRINEILGEIKLIEHSEFFDAEWYKETYNLDKCENLAGHYLFIGYKLGYDPSEKFSTENYFLCNDDVKEHDVNPLYHYEKYGKYEGRDKELYNIEEIVQNENLEVNETEEVTEDPEEEMPSGAKLIKYSEFFDEEWYRSEYEIPNNINAAEHYFAVGYKLGYNPSAFFSTEGYLKWNDDVKQAGINPLEHYEVCGKEEFRIINYVE